MWWLGSVSVWGSVHICVVSGKFECLVKCECMCGDWGSVSVL